MKQILQDDELNNVSGGTGEAAAGQSQMLGGPLVSQEEKDKMVQFNAAWHTVYGGVGGMNPGPFVKEAVFEAWKKEDKYMTPPAEFIMTKSAKPGI